MTSVVLFSKPLPQVYTRGKCQVNSHRARLQNLTSSLQNFQGHKNKGVRDTVTRSPRTQDKDTTWDSGWDPETDGGQAPKRKPTKNADFPKEGVAHTTLMENGSCRKVVAKVSAFVSL